MPKRAYICNEEECNKLSVSRDAIRKHCNKAHRWKSSKEQRTYWHEAWVQTFFNTGLQRYFTVSYGGPSSPRKKGGRVVNIDTEDSSFNSILEEWDQDLEKQRQALEIADKEVAKTDHTLWFKRNEWPEHLAGCNLRHLSRISRLPDKNERILQRAVEINVALVEACVTGLKSLDPETRRWLRSAKLSEIDQRPLARLQNPETQQRYSTYYSRLLCYSLRVLQSKNVESTAYGVDSAPIQNFVGFRNPEAELIQARVDSFRVRLITPECAQIRECCRASIGKQFLHEAHYRRSRGYCIVAIDIQRGEVVNAPRTD